jgi:hypothetical protein
MSHAGTSARRGKATPAWALVAESRIEIRQDDDRLAVTIEATRPWTGKGLRQGEPATLTIAEDRGILLYPNGAVAQVEREGEPPLVSCVFPVTATNQPPRVGPVAEFWGLLVMLHAAARDGTESAKTVKALAGPITALVKLKLSHDEHPCPDGKPGSCRRGLLTSAFQDGWDRGEPPQEVTTTSLLLDRDMRPWRFTRRTVQQDSGRVITFVVDFRPTIATAEHPRRTGRGLGSPETPPAQHDQDGANQRK